MDVLQRDLPRAEGIDARALCPAGGITGMVRLPMGFCIDGNEVTREQYGQWLAKSPSTTGQDPWCAWNSDLTPDSKCMAEQTVCQNPGCEKHPQVCVDWCDAQAYCKAMGKRLCGRIDGGASGFNDYENPARDQWFNACSSGGKSAYPYGDTYDAQACKGVERVGVGTVKTVEVATLSTCQSSTAGYAGVFDLSGNAAEWVNSCSGEKSGTDPCYIRGGGGEGGKVDLLCKTVYGIERRTALPTVGFRCCVP